MSRTLHKSKFKKIVLGLLLISLTVSCKSTINCSQASAGVIVRQNTNSSYVNYGGKGTLKIGSNVKGLAENNVYFFNNCISSVEVSSDNKYLKSKDGVLYSKDMKTLYYYPAMKKSKKFTIPSSVTKVSKYAFHKNVFVEQINMGKNVKNVGVKAFSECYKLKKFVWKCNAGTIPNGCFEKCGSLEVIELGDKVRNIKKAAFKQCNSLNTIEISKGINEIQDGAFSGACNEFLADEDNDNYASKDGVLFTKDMSELVAYPGTKQGAYIVPDRIKKIWQGAFQYSLGLTEITFGENISTIDMGSLNKCSNLKKINLPDGLQNIVSSVNYNGLFSLNQIKLSKANKYFSIYDGALYSDDYKTLYVIPFGKKRLELAPQVEKITYWENIKNKYDNILTSNSLANINISSENKYFTTVDGVLYNKEITDIVIMPGKMTCYKMPATVKNIIGLVNGFWGENANNIIKNNLSEIIVDKNNSLYTSKNGVLFSKDLKKMYVYPQEKKGGYIIPAKTVSTDYFAFTGTRGLTKLTIQKKCKRAYMNMSGCTGLKMIVVEDGVKSFRIETAQTLGIEQLKLGKDVSDICLQGNLSKNHTTIISSSAKKNKSVKIYTGIQAICGDGDEELNFLTFKNMNQYVKFMGYRFKYI